MVGREIKSRVYPLFFRVGREGEALSAKEGLPGAASKRGEGKKSVCPPIEKPGGKERPIFPPKREKKKGILYVHFSPGGGKKGGGNWKKKGLSEPSGTTRVREDPFSKANRNPRGMGRRGFPEKARGGSQQDFHVKIREGKKKRQGRRSRTKCANRLYRPRGGEDKEGGGEGLNAKRKSEGKKPSVTKRGGESMNPAATFEAQGTLNTHAREKKERTESLRSREGRPKGKEKKNWKKESYTDRGGVFFWGGGGGGIFERGLSVRGSAGKERRGEKEITEGKETQKGGRGLACNLTKKGGKFPDSLKRYNET